MAERLSIEWSANASLNLDSFYTFILNQWSFAEAERFLDQVQEFENIIAEYPNAFIGSRKRKKYKIGLIHKHVSGVYEIKKSKIFIVALIDNRAKPKFR